MGEYVKLCGKVGPRDEAGRETVCLDDDTHVGHHTYVSRVDPDALAAARRSLEEARGALHGLDAWMIALGALEGSPDWRAWLKRVQDAISVLAPPAATPPPCASWCGKRHDTHEHDYGEVFQDMPARVQMTRCYCTAACRDAGAPRNPVKP